MNEYTFFVDSSCDTPVSYLEAWGVKCIDLTFRFVDSQTEYKNSQIDGRESGIGQIQRFQFGQRRKITQGIQTCIFQIYLQWWNSPDLSSGDRIAKRKLHFDNGCVPS